MKRTEVNQTQQWIMDALLSMMEKKRYRDITIVDLVTRAHIGRRTFYRHFSAKDDILILYWETILKDFAEKILEKDEMNLYTVSLSYFQFWEQHLHFLRLLKHSEMLYFIGDRLPEALAQTAIVVKHVHPDHAVDVHDKNNQYYYTFHFNIGGYWSITTKWAEKENRETPEAMAQTIVDIIYRK